MSILAARHGRDLFRLSISWTARPKASLPANRKTNTAFILQPLYRPLRLRIGFAVGTDVAAFQERYSTLSAREREVMGLTLRHARVLVFSQLAEASALAGRKSAQEGLTVLGPRNHGRVLKRPAIGGTVTGGLATASAERSKGNQ